MKSNTLKILLISLTLLLASCMPDSVTKFKEDPPKKTAPVSSGGTVVIPEDLYTGNGVICSTGNGLNTVEGAGQDLIIAAPIALPFTSETSFLTTPYTLDGVNDPNYEFIVVGNNTDELKDIAGNSGIECHFADDATTTDFDGEVLGAKLSWSISPTLPTGLTLDTSAGIKVTGTLSGFNEMTLYTLTATNDDTGVAESDQFEIASSTPVTNDFDTANNDGKISYYTQMNGTQWAMKVANSSSFTPNHWVVNRKGAYAVINFIDRDNNILYLTIMTPAASDYKKYFKNTDEIDQVIPVGTPSFSQALTTIDDLYATLLVGTDDLSSYGGGTDDTALHFTETSGFVRKSTQGGYDGLTAVALNTELTEWVRCTHSPDITTLGTVDFLDGVLAATADPLTDPTDITNWGLDGTTLAVDDDVAGNLNRLCEFSGVFSTAFPYTKITTTLHTYAGETTTATLGLQAKSTIRQPFPITNLQSDDNDKAFYFHYKYTDGSTAITDKAKLVLTVANASQFRYNDADPANNKISNDRGTKGEITFISGNKIYVTLDNNAANPNAAYAFVLGDGVDNTSTFLTAETIVTDLEYTFEIGKAASATTIFTPQLPLNKAADRLNVDAAGLVLTPYGTNQFSSEFLNQVKVNGEISILNDNDLVEKRRISSINLTPGAHSITMAAAYTTGIPSDINRLAYISPLDASVNELGTITYGIDSYVGIVPAGPTCTGCAVGDLVLVANPNNSLAPLVTFSPTTGIIQIANDLTRAQSSQTFNITATDIQGYTATTQFDLSIAAPPAGLSLNRNLLLTVPSGSAYKIGSYISSNNADPGLGVVKDIIPDKTSSAYVLDIQLIKGSFAPDDDLDNRQSFDSQKTYIYADGVIPYNVAVYKGVSGATLNSDSFFDRYSCATPNFRKFTDGAAWDSATTRGIVAYTWDTTNGVSTLIPTTTERIYLQLEKGTISDSTSIAPMNCAGTLAAAQTYDEIISDNMLLTHGVNANLDTGLNLTSNDGANRGAGVIHKEQSTTLTYAGQYYFAPSAIFLTGQNLDNVNPFVGTEDTIAAVTMDHTFYLYRFEEAAIEFNLEVGDDTALEFLEYDGGGYCISCATTPCTSFSSRNSCEGDTGTWVPTEPASFPPGLEYSNTTGRISGEPLINADKQKFVLRASNPYGSINHIFELKVYDHFKIAPTDTTAKPKPDSYIMHQVGYGMANVPCRVTQEAMDTGNADVVDLTCVMDGGESDIFYKGLNLTVRTGDDMCTAVNHVPYYYYDWPYVKTANAAGTLYKNTGSYDDPLCGNQPEYTIDSSALFINGNGGVDPNLTAAGISSSVGEVCKSTFSAVGALVPGGDFGDEAPAGPNCDDGTVTYNTVDWSVQGFVCTDGSGNPDTTSSTIVQCSGNNGTCTDGADADLICSGCGANDDCADCANLTECTAAGDVWTADYFHNDAATALNYDPGIGDWGCAPTAAPTTSEVDCGGTQGMCISGAGSDTTPISLSPSELAQKFAIAHVMTNSNQVDIGYKAPFDKGASTNLYLANYMNRTTCETGPYDFNWSTAGANNDWIDYSSEAPSGAGHPFAGGYNYYQYSCDTGAGLAARVRMLVREFDANFTVTDGIEEILLGVYSAGAGGNLMDDNDPASTNCSFPVCNNRGDLDDYYTSNTSCGNADLTFDFDPPNLQTFPRETSP